MKATWKWFVVFIYTIGLFVATPYLPQLIQAATSRWSRSGVSRFILGVEIAIALVLAALAVYFVIQKKKKSLVFVVSIGCIFLLAFIIYQFIPNPYEFTHLPEYAVLSMLIFWAMNDTSKSYANRKKYIKMKIFKNIYFQSGIITGTIGSTDEIYQLFLRNRSYTWYDIFLNIIGGILGLIILWGIKR